MNPVLRWVSSSRICWSWEREVDRERDRDLRLGDEHGAGFGDGGALPLPGRQEPVFGPGRLGGVEASHDPDGGVGDDAPFDLARRLLRPDKDDPERAAAFGDIKQDVFDRAGPLARGVLVQFVDHREQEAAGPGSLLTGGFGGQDDTDDEPLSPFGEVVQVDQGDLLTIGGDLTAADRARRAAGPGRVRQVAADQIGQCPLA